MNTAELKGANYFLAIPASVAHDRRIKSARSVLLFGEIYAMLNVTGKFYMNNETLAERMNCSTRTITRCMTELEDLGYIRSEVTQSSDGKTYQRIVSIPRVDMGVQGVSTSMSRGYRHERLGGIDTGVDIIEQSNRSINRTTNIKQARPASRTEGSSKDPQIVAQRKEIIDYLNKKTGKHYKYNSYANEKIIDPRLKEGYTVDDLKHVIDVKYQQWHGVTFKDKNSGAEKLGDNYLKPESLFRPTRIDGYVNEQLEESTTTTTDDEYANDPWFR